VSNMNPVPPLPHGGDGADDLPTREDADGDVTIDPDANDDLVDSAEADRVAADPDAE
jgi:hypothetical protein